MTATVPFEEIARELTLLDLVLAVDELTRSDEETAIAVSSMLDSGRVRLRLPLHPGAPRRAPGPPRRRRRGRA